MFSEHNGNQILQLPTYLTGFTNLSANTIRGIEHATDNTKNGTLYYEPTLCTLFDHVIDEGATLNGELVSKFKSRRQIVSRKKSNMAILDRIYVDQASIDESTPLRSERHARVVMNQYYTGENPRFDTNMSDVVGAEFALGYDLPIHSAAQAKSSHSMTDPRIKCTHLRKLSRTSGDKRKKVSTTTILKRTPEMDSFVLLINSWTNITTVENVYDGNFWSDYLSGLDNLESVKKLQQSSASLFPNEYKKTSELPRPRKRQVVVEFDNDEEYAVYDCLSAASKTAFRNGKLHLRKLKKLKQLETSTIKLDKFFGNHL